MQLNKEVIARLNTPMWATWNYIGHDVIEFCEDNECAIEMCIDADRLASCANDQGAQDLVRELIAEHGYNTVLKFLSKNFCYV